MSLDYKFAVTVSMLKVIRRNIERKKNKRKKWRHKILIFNLLNVTHYISEAALILHFIPFLYSLVSQNL